MFLFYGPLSFFMDSLSDFRGTAGALSLSVVCVCGGLYLLRVAGLACSHPFRWHSILVVLAFICACWLPGGWELENMAPVYTAHWLQLVASWAGVPCDATLSQSL